jgi:hypothetical protein
MTLRTIAIAIPFAAMIGCGAVFGLSDEPGDSSPDGGEDGSDGSPITADGEIRTDGQSSTEDGAPSDGAGGLDGGKCTEEGSSCVAQSCCTGLTCLPTANGDAVCNACLAFNEICNRSAPKCCGEAICFRKGGAITPVCCKPVDTACTVAKAQQCCSGTCVNGMCG